MRWRDAVDMDFVEWLTSVIILHDPTEQCRRRGSLLAWHGLAHDKSLFHSPPGCGLPIGNLTSQLFSNVYLNELDQYVKRTLHCRHYGRYVDDFYVVSTDRDWLLSLRRPVAGFLRDRLGLEVNTGKTTVSDVRRGVSFLGAWLKPCRRYVISGALSRMAAKLQAVDGSIPPEQLRSRLNSMLGLLCHYSSYWRRRELFLPLSFAYRHGYFQKGMLKYVLYPALS